MRRNTASLVLGLLVPTLLTAQDNPPLRGAWMAVSYAVSGRAAPAPSRGMVLFFDSTYSFVAEKWPRASTGDTLTAAEKVAAFDGFLASSGSYELVGDSLTTRAYIHLDPVATRAWPNRTRRYRIRIEGDTLHWDFGDGVGKFRRTEGGLPPR